MIRLIIGLMCVMSANILLGVTIAKIKREFKKEFLVNGIFKATMLAFSTVLVYMCGYLNPDIAAIEINGNMVSLIEGVELICTTGVIYYGALSLKKIAETIKISTMCTEEKSENSLKD